MGICRACPRQFYCAVSFPWRTCSFRVHWCQGWWLLKLHCLILSLRKFLVLQKYFLDSLNHIYIWRVSPPLRKSPALTPVNCEHGFQLINNIENNRKYVTDENGFVQTYLNTCDEYNFTNLNSRPTVAIFEYKSILDRVFYGADVELEKPFYSSQTTTSDIPSHLQFPIHLIITIDR